MDAIREQLKRCNLLLAETDAAYHEAALKMGLSDSAMLLLMALCEHGGSCLLSEVIRATGLMKQTINSALRKLERDGVVALAPIDGRQKRIMLTPQGERFTEQNVRKLMRLEEEIFGAWSAEDRETYLVLMQRYLEDFRAKTEELT